jgi:hypothetical protein
MNVQSAKLKIAINESGQGSLMLDGVEISSAVSAVEFCSKGGSLTTVKITLQAEVDAEIAAHVDQIALAKIEEPGEFVRTADGRKLPVRR